MRRLLLTLLVIALVTAGALALWPADDDRPVDPSAADARRAIAVALEIVPGRVTQVARDRDNGKWEVTVHWDQHDFEVELHPRDFALLGIDYD